MVKNHCPESLVVSQRVLGKINNRLSEARCESGLEYLNLCVDALIQN